MEISGEKKEGDKQKIGDPHPQAEDHAPPLVGTVAKSTPRSTSGRTRCTRSASSVCPHNGKWAPILTPSSKDDETAKVAEISNCPVIISGGVSSIDDIKKAKNLKNVEGIIVGKAIYDGDIKLEELVKEDA